MFVSGVLGTPIAFSQVDIATRAPTQIWRFQDEKMIPHAAVGGARDLADVIPNTARPEHNVLRGVPLTEAAAHIAREMKGIDMVRLDSVDVQLRTADPTQSMMLIDTVSAAVSPSSCERCPGSVD